MVQIELYRALQNSTVLKNKLENTYKTQIIFHKLM